MSALLSLEEARERILAAVAGPLAAETVGLEEALGRVLAEPVRSTTDLPPWDNSAMDGYAIRAADVATASEAAPVRLMVIGEVAAGAAPELVVTAGTAARIATGALVPPGADAVVPVELTTPLDPAGVAGPRGREATGSLPSACLVHEAVRTGSSIRRRGEDLGAGSIVLAAGSVISAAGVTIAAGSGVAAVRAHRRPRVGVLATGDEVRSPGEPLGPAGLPDANGPGLRALVRTAGGEAVALGVARDRLGDVVGRLRSALDLVDALIVSGGVSVGPYDVVRGAFEAIGRVDLWRVAIQPGKPFAFGLAERAGQRPVLLFGLPGNPVSSFVTFELFVRPALRRLAGHAQLIQPPDRAVLEDQVTKSHGRRAFVRVAAVRGPTGGPLRDERGRVSVRLAGGQGSHMLTALAAADALAVIPEAHDTLPAGSEVELWWLDRA